MERMKTERVDLLQVSERLGAIVERATGRSTDKGSAT